MPLPKILLFGRVGQVGWELRRTLAPLSQLVCVDYPEVDLTNPGSIRKWIQDTAPEIVINAAAYTAVDKAETEGDLAMKINAGAPEVMAVEARKKGCNVTVQLRQLRSSTDMISKHLTIAAAFVLLTGFGVGPALAQATGGATAPATTTALRPLRLPLLRRPQPSSRPGRRQRDQENPYGLGDIIKKKNPVSYTVLGILLVMSVGTWYIFFTKYFDQGRILSQARIVERRFWTSGTLNEGIEKLPKNSMFRAIAEAGVRAAAGGTSLVSLNDWIAMSLARQLEDATGKLAGRRHLPRIGRFGGSLRRSVRNGLGHPASPDRHRRRRPGLDRQGRGSGG